MAQCGGVYKKAKHSNLGVAKFLQVTRSFVCKFRKEMNENSEVELGTSKGNGACK